MSGLDSTWRLVDAYVPRIFGLIFQTFLIAEFGADLYALPGWVLGTFGLILVIIPDPHSYIIVRANGARAQTLYALTVPSALLKILVASGLALIGLTATSTGQIAEPHGSDWLYVALAALLYGSTEFLWAVLGTVSLANGKVRKTALSGIAARLIALCLLLFAWSTGGVGIATNLALATAPVFIGWCVLSPISRRWKRVRFFFVYGLIRYAGWLQGVALITTGLFQMPMVVLGMWPSADPSLVGMIAFTNRLLLAGFQPFQILQSVVIRDASVARSHNNPIDRTSLWIVFKAGGLAFAIATQVGLAIAWWTGRIDGDAHILGAALSLGVAISIWYRHELAVALAVRSARSVFLLGYVPTLIIAALLTPVLIQFFGVYGLSLAVIGSWVTLSNSWRWVA